MGAGAWGAADGIGLGARLAAPKSGPARAAADKLGAGQLGAGRRGRSSARREMAADEFWLGAGTAADEAGLRGGAAAAGASGAMVFGWMINCGRKCCSVPGTELMSALSDDHGSAWQSNRDHPIAPA